MWSVLLERISMQTLIYAAFSAVIPWVIYKVNSSIRGYGDPPWKKEFTEEKKEKNS